MEMNLEIGDGSMSSTADSMKAAKVIAIWPDGTWCYRADIEYALNIMKKSDDYDVVTQEAFDIYLEMDKKTDEIEYIGRG